MDFFVEAVLSVLRCIRHDKPIYPRGTERIMRARGPTQDSWANLSTIQMTWSENTAVLWRQAALLLCLSVDHAYRAPTGLSWRHMTSINSTLAGWAAANSRPSACQCRLTPPAKHCQSTLDWVKTTEQPQIHTHTHTHTHTQGDS